MGDKGILLANRQLSSIAFNCVKRSLWEGVYEALKALKTR